MIRPRLALARIGHWGIRLASLASLACGSIERPGDPTRLADQITQAEVLRGDYAPDLLFSIGQVIFSRVFSCAQGAGHRTSPTAPCTFPRTLGPEAQSCLECHDAPLRDGAGARSNNVFRLPDDAGLPQSERNPPHLFGVGYVEALGKELTLALIEQRNQALLLSSQRGTPVEIMLSAKGLEFGRLRAQPDGSVQLLDHAVSADLIVRPFAAKGLFSTIRQQNLDALVGHMGLQSTELFGEGVDADADGVANEISAGQLSALEVYQALLAVPSFVPVGAHPADGAKRFQEVGCADCHTPYLRLESPRLALAQATPDQQLIVDLLRDTETPRALGVASQGPVLVPLFSDFRRHDLGSPLADGRPWPLLPSARIPVPRPSSPDLALYPAVDAPLFLTTRLWGVASTAPYLHDGRAATLQEAILAHGGEGATSRDQFVALSPAAQQDLLDFLASLVLLRGSGSGGLPPTSAGAGY